MVVLEKGATATSVRSKSKPKPKHDVPRKTVFRTVLSNPLTVEWPPLGSSVRELLLEGLMEYINTPADATDISISKWRLREHARRRGRTPALNREVPSAKIEIDRKRKASHAIARGTATKKFKLDTSGTSTDGAIEQGINPVHSLSLRSRIVDIPDLKDHPPTTRVMQAQLPVPLKLRHMNIGINEVTRALESRIRSGRTKLGDDSSAADWGKSSTKSGKRRRHHGGKNKERYRVHISDQDLDEESKISISTQPISNTAASSAPFTRPLSSKGRLHLEEKEAAACSDELLDIIFVCVPDINPTSLVAHLPTMCAASNGVGEAIRLVFQSNQDNIPSSKEGSPEELKEDIEHLKEEIPSELRTTNSAENVNELTPSGTASNSHQVANLSREVYLVPLGIGAEVHLGDVLALRRVAAIGLRSTAPGISALVDLVKRHVQPLQAPWLIPHVMYPTPKAPTLVSTHIKHLRTSIPVDLKGAKAAKKHAKDLRKAAKKRDKLPIYVAQDE